MKALKIHFLNVGKGNCTIIEFPSGRLAMIDIDNSRISDNERVLTDPIEYLQDNFKGRPLFRFILTHPDMDHMSGLDELASKVSILNFWDTEHNKTISEDDWEGSPYNLKEWEQYLKFRGSSEDPKCLKLHRGDTSECCWTQDGIKIMSPSPHLVGISNTTSEYNHLSYVLMVEYAGFKVLLGGDASTEAWDDILKELGKESLESDIFLAPHHGSENNIHEEAFEKMTPEYMIVSVAEGVEYDYDYYSRLATKGVLSTKHYSTIKLEVSDSGDCEIILERNV